VSDPVIVATARSPIGRARKGSLVDLRADEMARQMAAAALAQVPELPVDEFEDLYLGVAHQVGEQAQNMARRVAVLLGRDDLPGATVSRACASSLLCVAMAANGVAAGAGDAYLAVGAESVSRYTKTAGPEDRSPDVPPAVEPGPAGWSDPRERDAIPDVYVDMGRTAENVAQRYGITRSEQDAFALRSQQRYAAADQRGFWAQEIVPLALPGGEAVRTDDSPRPATTEEALAGLKPAFRDGGSVTAGNACPLNDGAAAVVVTSTERARQAGARPLARIRAVATAGVSPEIMGIGPVPACRRALARAGLRLGDVDLIEINEAFASQVVASARELGLDPEQVNPYGGAIALGHPFGMTGARLLTTAIHGLQDQDAAIALVSLCVGGGMGMAVVLERLS
jgi:acetyl-CoA C-acetyltransferase